MKDCSFIESSCGPSQNDQDFLYVLRNYAIALKYNTKPELVCYGLVL